MKFNGYPRLMALKIFIIRGIKSKVDTNHPFSGWNLSGKITRGFINVRQSRPASKIIDTVHTDNFRITEYIIAQ